MTRVVVPIAAGFEEIETMTVVDILRRADIEVVTAAIAETPVTSSHGVRVEADTTIEAIQDDPEIEMVVLPGGPGTRKLGESKALRHLVERLQQADREIAAICAAPSVLADYGLLKGKRATSFPAVRDRLVASGADYREESVVRDGKVITSRGPGTAMDFALELVAVLAGTDKRQEVEARLIRPTTQTS